MRQATFGTDLHGRQVTQNRVTWRFPAAEVAVASGTQRAALVFGAPTTQVTDKVIRAHLSVTNPTDQVVPIVVFPSGGAFPYGGTTPFTLRFNAASPVKYTGQLFPPAPPLPMHIDFPPMTEVRFEAIVGLKPWSWADDPEVSLDWGFRFASGSNGGLDFSYDRIPERHAHRAAASPIVIMRGRDGRSIDRATRGRNTRAPLVVDGARAHANAPSCASCSALHAFSRKGGCIIGRSTGHVSGATSATASSPASASASASGASRPQPSAQAKSTRRIRGW